MIVERMTRRVIPALGERGAMADDPSVERDRLRATVGELTGELERSRSAQAVLAREVERLRDAVESHQRERQLLAYEIHDGIAQDVLASIMLLEAMLKTKPLGPERETVAKVIDTLRAGVADARRLINGLRPPGLEEFGLTGAIEHWIHGFSQATGVAVILDAHLEIPQSAPDVETAVFRLVQEAVHNAWRHGEADEIRVTMKEENGRLRTTIVDRGKGFDVNRESDRLGLAGMRQRAHWLGGRVEIASRPGHGTTINAWFPWGA